jgi:hypothetical protein
MKSYDPVSGQFFVVESLPALPNLPSGHTPVKTPKGWRLLEHFTNTLVSVDTFRAFADAASLSYLGHRVAVYEVCDRARALLDSDTHLSESVATLSEGAIFSSSFVSLCREGYDASKAKLALCRTIEEMTNAQEISEMSSMPPASALLSPS